MTDTSFQIVCGPKSFGKSRTLLTVLESWLPQMLDAQRLTERAVECSSLRQRKITPTSMKDFGTRSGRTAKLEMLSYMYRGSCTTKEPSPLVELKLDHLEKRMMMLYGMTTTLSRISQTKAYKLRMTSCGVANLTSFQHESTRYPPFVPTLAEIPV